MNDPKTQAIGDRLADAQSAGQSAVAKHKLTLQEMQDAIAKGKGTVEIIDAMTGNHIPFAKEAEEIADVATQGIGLFARLKRLWGKKKSK